MAPSSADTKQNGLGWNLNEMLDHEENTPYYMDHEVDIGTTSYHLIQTKVNIKCIGMYSCFHMYRKKLTSSQRTPMRQQVTVNEGLNEHL